MLKVVWEAVINSFSDMLDSVFCVAGKREGLLKGGKLEKSLSSGYPEIHYYTGDRFLNHGS